MAARNHQKIALLSSMVVDNTITTSQVLSNRTILFNNALSILNGSVDVPGPLDMNYFTSNFFFFFFFFFFFK
jgi:hypothetical protein